MSSSLCELSCSIENDNEDFVVVTQWITILQYFQRFFKIFFAPENMKKLSSKVAHNRPKLFFSVLQINPKPAQITFSVQKKCLRARILYNDFADKTNETNKKIQLKKLWTQNWVSITKKTACYF